MWKTMSVCVHVCVCVCVWVCVCGCVCVGVCVYVCTFACVSVLLNVLLVSRSLMDKIGTFQVGCKRPVEYNYTRKIHIP